MEASHVGPLLPDTDYAIWVPLAQGGQGNPHPDGYRINVTVSLVRNKMENPFSRSDAIVSAQAILVP